MPKLIAYQIRAGQSAPLRPSPRERGWMNETEKGFAYRCLPLVLANCYGWEVLSTERIRATWNGRPEPAGLRVNRPSRTGRSCCHSHFGAGILTFQIPFLFRTPPDWDLMVRGPMNRPKDGIAALDAIVETDWAHSTFTMNWLFTRPGTVEFAVGEPVCLFFPVQRGLLKTFACEIRALASNKSLQKKYEAWSLRRDQSLWRLHEEAPQRYSDRFEKDYVRSARSKRTFTRPFADTVMSSTKEKRKK